MMRKRIVWMASFCLLALFCMAGAAAAEEQNETMILDDVEPYNGPIGPGNPLYGLKIALEDLDLTFTTDETEYIDKQLKHGRLRLSEVRSELQQNNTEAAERALALYLQSTNATRLRLTASNETGFLHAQQTVLKHQLVLQNLLNANPNSTGLQQAYNNSLALEQKFQEKTQVRFERLAEKNNATFMKALRIEIKQQQKAENRVNQTAGAEETTHGPVNAAGNNANNTDKGNNTGMDQDKGAKVAPGLLKNGKGGAST